jgi:hypothetical protein
VAARGTFLILYLVLKKIVQLRAKKQMQEKGAAAPEVDQCGSCSAPEGQNGVTL